MLVTGSEAVSEFTYRLLWPLHTVLGIRGGIRTSQLAAALAPPPANDD